MWYIYTMEYYSAIRKDELMPFVATWINLEIIILSEVSQSEVSESHSVMFDSATPWTVQSVKFSRPEYWSG